MQRAAISQFTGLGYFVEYILIHDYTFLLFRTCVFQKFSDAYLENKTGFDEHVTCAAIAKERSKTLGKARLGGDWELVNTAGQKVTNKDFFGKWILLYFGFTHCPDICPDELEKMANVVDQIGKWPTERVKVLLLMY